MRIAISHLTRLDFATEVMESVMDTHLGPLDDADQYVDKQAVAGEIAAARKLCAKHNWPIIDVTRRSIEETAAAVMALLADRRRQQAS